MLHKHIGFSFSLYFLLSFYLWKTTTENNKIPLPRRRHFVWMRSFTLWLRISFCRHKRRHKRPLNITVSKPNAQCPYNSWGYVYVACQRHLIMSRHDVWKRHLPNDKDRDRTQVQPFSDNMAIHFQRVRRKWLCTLAIYTRRPFDCTLNVMFWLHTLYYIYMKNAFSSSAFGPKSFTTLLSSMSLLWRVSAGSETVWLLAATIRTEFLWQTLSRRGVNINRDLPLCMCPIHL